MDGKFVSVGEWCMWDEGTRSYLKQWCITDLQNTNIKINGTSSSSSVPADIGNFGGSENPLASLSKLFGMDSVFHTKSAFLTSLDKMIAKDSEELTKTLGDKLKKAGLGDVTKKITFAEDKDGNIVIEGNISAKQKKRLAQIINDDPELVERIKTQKARMEIAEELKKDGQVDEKTKKTYKADLSDKKFDAARTQLLKSFLSEQGLSLKDAANSNNEQIKNLLNSFPELDSEVNAYLNRRNTSATTAVDTSAISSTLQDGKTEESAGVRSLLSMKRGMLSEATEDEPGFGAGLAELRNDIYKEIVDKYNKKFREVNTSWQIASFSMKFDSDGRLRITDVQTGSDDPKASAQAERTMNNWLTQEMKEAGKELGSAILDDHDDKHGDVEEFKHEVIVGSGGGIKVLSADADKAAMAELEEITQDLGNALGNFFKNTLGIESSFAVIFGQDGTLSFDKGALSAMESDMVKQVMEDLNAYLAAENAGEDTEGMLSPELTGIGNKLLALKEVMDKVHDKSLLPKEGVRWGM
jgi:hypothetical protein